LAFTVFAISRTTYDIHGEGVQAITRVLLSSFLALFMLAVVITFVVFWLCVRISHRFYGPMVPIRRHLVALRAGDYSKRLILRKDDEFRELEQLLNDLAADLERK
jgi:signal transduction histidine kinase